MVSWPTAASAVPSATRPCRTPALARDVLPRRHVEVAEGGVRRVAVVALQVVLDDELPVGVQESLAPAHRPHPRQLREVGEQQRFQPAGRLGGRRRGAIVAHHDEARERRHGDRGKAEARLVEASDGVAVGCLAQAAVEPVGPGVVGAGDGRLQRAAAVEQAMAAVLAGVVEAAQGAVAAVDDDDLLAADAQAEVAPWPGDLACVAGGQPGAAEDPLHLQLEDGGIAVPGARQRRVHDGLAGDGPACDAVRQAAPPARRNGRWPRRVAAIRRRPGFHQPGWEPN